MLRYKLLLIVILFGLYSCKNYSIKTIVYEDGSIEKIIKVSSRDKITDYNSLFFRVDDSWEIEQEQDSSTSGYVLTAKRKFASVQELIEKYGSPHGVVMEVNLARKFRWFYTYYEYEEIIERTNPFNAVKVEDYLSAAEYKELTSGGEISESLSDKLNEYLQASAYKELLDNLSALFERSGLDPKLLRESEGELIGLFEDDNELEFILDRLNNIYPPSEISKLEKEIGGIYNELEKKAERIFTNVGSEFSYNIELPGLILETNAQSIEGTSGYWKFDTENFTFVDYRMHIESRKANVWTMIATGGLVIGLIALLLVPSLRKRH